MICCRDCATLLIDYVDNELSIQQRLEVEEHLNECGSCRTYAQTYQLTVQLPRKLAEKPLPPELVQRLQKALAPHCGAQQHAPPPP